MVEMEQREIFSAAFVALQDIFSAIRRSPTNSHVFLQDTFSAIRRLPTNSQSFTRYLLLLFAVDLHIAEASASLCPQTETA